MTVALPSDQESRLAELQNLVDHILKSLPSACHSVRDLLTLQQQETLEALAGTASLALVSIKALVDDVSHRMTESTNSSLKPSLLRTPSPTIITNGDQNQAAARALISFSQQQQQRQQKSASANRVGKVVETPTHTSKRHSDGDIGQSSKRRKHNETVIDEDARSTSESVSGVAESEQLGNQVEEPEHEDSEQEEPDYVVSESERSDDNDNSADTSRSRRPLPATLQLQKSSEQRLQSIRNGVRPARTRARSLSLPKSDEGLPSKSKIKSPPSKVKASKMQDVQTSKKMTLAASKDLEFPICRSRAFPQAMAKVLDGVDAIHVEEEQWAYYRDHAVMPITALQWAHLPQLIDEVQEKIQSDGAIMLQPQWDTVTEDSTSKRKRLNGHLKDVSFKPLGIGAVPGPDHPFYRIFERVKRNHRVRAVPETKQALLRPDELEQAMIKGHFAPFYANDLDLRFEQKLATHLGVEPRLRSLPGNELPTTLHYPGINDSYLYLGQRGSTFCLHTEDEMLHSLAIVHSGQKVWQVFSPDCKRDVEQLVRTFQTEACKCDQFVRYEQLYLPQAVVKKSNLKSRVFIQQAGQVLITFPGAYHQGYNGTTVVSEAINYAHNWKPYSYQNKFSGCSRCQRETSIFFSTDMNLNQPINDIEVVTNKHIMGAEEAIKHFKQDLDSKAQALHTTGVALVDLIRPMIPYILKVASYKVLEALQNHSQVMVENVAQDTDAETLRILRLYQRMRRADDLSSIIQATQRYSVWKISEYLCRLQQDRRKSRSHVKGQGKVVPWSAVVSKVAAKISNDEKKRAEATKLLRSYLFRRSGYAYERLSDVVDSGIIWLLPDRSIAKEAGADEYWLGEVFRYDELAKLFTDLITILRPKLAGLCGPNASGQSFHQLWSTLAEHMEDPNLENTVLPLKS